MPTVLSRMRRMKTKLLDIRLGPGAAVMSPSVQRIHMKFAVKINNGHMGPRKFWHHYLPRLKYHNPAVPMTVERTTDQGGPASMTVYFASHNSGATSESENSQIIDMKHKTSDDILSEFLKLTSGVPVEATEEELEDLRKLEEERARIEADRAFSAKQREQKRRQTAILERAKQMGQ